MITDEEQTEQKEEYLQVTIDFTEWAKEWLQGEQTDANDLASLLRASFEKNIPHRFVTIEKVST